MNAKRKLLTQADETPKGTAPDCRPAPKSQMMVAMTAVIRRALSPRSRVKKESARTR
jgi:hypothetical protein